MRKLKNSELNRKNIDEFKQSDKTPLIVILDNIRSLNNIGSVFRTADSLILEKIYLCGITATPPNKDIHKTALGATESVNWEYSKTTLDVIQKLKTENYIIISAEQTVDSVMLQDFKANKEHKYAVIFGHEVKGVDQEVINNSDLCVEIPQYGTKHSFNISVSAGIILWDIFKQIKF
jgi:tRNA G18 (ribose-2'-O)-methylase SpoU